MTNPVVAELLGRSNRLGADPRNTNYAGGNTSATGTETDPVTGRPVDLLWVKGSGGDLGTLTEAGLAVLRLDRLRSLVDVYPGVDREDEMVAAFDYCLHGRGGAAPSIDTAMHGLVRAPHVDHLHPDSGIALATAADGEQLTRECFGDRVVWVPWRRPGFQLGLDIAAIAEKNPQAIGCILGGHGVTAWGETSEECEANSTDIIRTAERFLAERGRPEPFGQALPGFEAMSDAERRIKAAALAPVIRGLASTDKPQVGHFTDTDVVLDFLASSEHPRLAALGTLVPRPLPAHQGPAAGRRPAGARPGRGRRRAAEGTARGVPRRVRGLLRPARDAGQPGHARGGPGDRAGARRRHVQLRREQADRAGGRRVLRQRHQRDARRGGGLHVRADRREREVPHRVLGAGGGQARADAEAEAAGHPRRAGHRCGVRHRQGDRRPAGRRGRVRRRRRPGPAQGAGRRCRDRRLGRGHRRRRRRQRRGGRGHRVPRRRARVRRGRPGGQQRRPVDLQAAAGDHRAGLGPAARRHGQGQLPRLPRGGPDHDRAGDGRRHRLHLQQELAVRRPEQHRLRRDQGRPGAPGAAARGRARPAPDPGQRHQPGRRRPRVGHLRRRLGRQRAPPSTGCPRTSSASSTPSAPCSSARSCPTTWPTPSSR